MKYNKLNLVNLLYIFIISIIIIYIIYIVFISISSISLYTKKKDIFENVPRPTCGSGDDLVSHCIDYELCCSGNISTKDCLCKHPFVNNCINKFNTCMAAQLPVPPIPDPNITYPFGVIPTPTKSISEIITINDNIKKNCIAKRQTCCVPYNSKSISNDKFNKPIKNDPIKSPNKICSLSSSNAEQKCLELCQTNPNCKAYSTNIGIIVQASGTCNLYNNINIDPIDIDPQTGKPKNEVLTNYYIKK